MGEAKWEAKFVAGDGWCIYVGNYEVADGLSKPDALRIVACVNALSGITNVEAMPEFFNDSVRLDGIWRDMILPREFEQVWEDWRRSFTTLYAPQASEAKPSVTCICSAERKDSPSTLGHRYDCPAYQPRSSKT